MNCFKLTKFKIFFNKKTKALADHRTIVIPIARTLGNICAGSGACTQFALDGR